MSHRLVPVKMNKNQSMFAVLAICAAILLAGVIIAYKPGLPEEQAGPDFRFPAGFGTALGAGAYTYQGDVDAKTISLTGSGSASATANEAVVILGVQTDDESAAEAIEENAETMTAVIAAIKGLGLTEDEISTTSYNVYPEYNWELRIVTGYRVTNMIRVEIEDLDIVGEVIDVAGEAGANRVDGISFGLSDEVSEPLKLEAYVAALEDAQEKADVIAGTLGLSITGVQSVSESSYIPTVPFRAVAEMDFAGASTPVLEGSLTVTVQIHIVYLFE